MKRRQLLAALPALAIAANSRAFAAPYFSGATPAAANGYDVVAYFNASTPTAGDPAIAHEWDGDVWYFSSTANRDAFVADPGAYAPQYGAYCAFAMAHGATASTDPEAWTVHNGKLYLNFSKSVRERWLQDMTDFIAAADTKWPGVQASL